MNNDIIVYNFFFIDNLHFYLFLNNFHNNKKYILDSTNCHLYEDLSGNNIYINKYKNYNYIFIKKILYINKILKNNNNYIKLCCLFTYSQIKKNIYKHIYKLYPNIKNENITIYYIMEINKLSNHFILSNYKKFYELNDIKLILSQLIFYQLHIFFNYGIIINSINLDNIFINIQDYTLLKYLILNTEYQLSSKYIYFINNYSKAFIYLNKLFIDKFNNNNCLLYNIYKTFIIFFDLFKYDSELEFYKNIINKQDFIINPLYSYITCDFLCKKILKSFYYNKLNYNDFIQKTLNIIINYINIIWSNLFGYELI